MNVTECCEHNVILNQGPPFCEALCVCGHTCDEHVEYRCVAGCTCNSFAPPRSAWRAVAPRNARKRERRARR